MPVMGVMQASLHQVIDVVAVRHRRMAAARPVRMPGRADVRRRAHIGVHIAHLQPAFVEMIAVGRVQAAIMQVVDVRTVLHGRVAASLTMHMRVVAVNFVTRHPTPIETDCRRNG